MKGYGLGEVMNSFSERHAFILGVGAGVAQGFQPVYMTPVNVSIVSYLLGFSGKTPADLKKTKGLKEVLKEPWYFVGGWLIGLAVFHGSKLL